MHDIYYNRSTYLQINSLKPKAWLHGSAMYKCYYDHEHCLEDTIRNPRKLHYWNSRDTEPGWLNFGIGNIFTIIMRYSFTLRSVVQYFVVLGNSIFLHFRTILNKLKKVASIRLWKDLRHINAYVLNKWRLKFPCAYLNTQGSCTTGTPVIRNQGG
ncbi:hypothetical protein T08_16578 [Trichinella sp. T8]|nr:hypothetical protein T08_16578 [Trichinella sp. T8]